MWRKYEKVVFLSGLFWCFLKFHDVWWQQTSTNPSRQLRALLPRGLGRQRSRDECKIYGVISCKFKDKMTTKRYTKSVSIFWYLLSLLILMRSSLHISPLSHGLLSGSSRWCWMDHYGSCQCCYVHPKSCSGRVWTREVRRLSRLFWHRRWEAAPCREGALAGCRDKPAEKTPLDTFQIGLQVSEWCGFSCDASNASNASNASSQFITWTALSPGKWAAARMEATLLQDLMCHIAKARASRGFAGFVMAQSSTIWEGAVRQFSPAFVCDLRCLKGTKGVEWPWTKCYKEHEHAVLCSVPCHATKKTTVQLQMAAGCRTILQQQRDHVARKSVQPDTGFDALDRCCHATTFSYHLNHLNFGKFRDIYRYLILVWYLFDTCHILSHLVTF